MVTLDFIRVYQR